MFSKFLWKEDGQILVFFALILALLMGIIAIVTDVGFMYTTKAELQNAADAAALSGAHALPGKSTAAVDMAAAAAQARTEALLPALSINWHAGDTVTPEVAADNMSITVTGSRNIDFTFARVIGLNGTTITAAATASIEAVPVYGMSGVHPLGIVSNDPSNWFEFGKTYTLMNGPGTGKNGNYQLLNFDGSGSGNIKSYSATGYPNEIFVGQQVALEPGQKTGQLNFPTTIIVVVVDTVSSSPATILGFALFENLTIQNGNAKKADTITGDFVKMIVPDASTGSGSGEFGLSTWKPRLTK